MLLHTNVFFSLFVYVCVCFGSMTDSPKRGEDDLALKYESSAVRAVLPPLLCVSTALQVFSKRILSAEFYSINSHIMGDGSSVCLFPNVPGPNQKWRGHGFLKCQGNIPEKGKRETESWVKLKVSQVPLWWFICAIKVPLLSLKLFVNVNKLFVKTDMCPAHAMNQYGRYNVTYLAVFCAIARQTVLSSQPQQS